MSAPTDAQYRARTQAINRRARAEERKAAALEEIGKQQRIANMLAAAGFQANSFQTTREYARALHKQVIAEIGVRP